MGRPTSKINKKGGGKSVTPKVSKDKVKKEYSKTSATGKSPVNSQRSTAAFITPKKVKHEHDLDGDNSISIKDEQDSESENESDWSATETGIEEHNSGSGKKASTEKDLVQESSPTTVFSQNGRVHGRKLVMWHRKSCHFLSIGLRQPPHDLRTFSSNSPRLLTSNILTLAIGPRMIEKLFYHVIYESHRAGIDLPWGAAVHRLSPGSSGQSAQQHLARFRDQLVAEGHLVPPLLGKRNIKQDPNIRGHVRDFTSEDPYAVRAVSWNEKIEDPKENLPIDDGIIRGSGRYKRGNHTGVTAHEIRRANGRRNRNPVDSQVRKQTNAAYDASDDEEEEWGYGDATNRPQEKTYNLRQTARNYFEKPDDEYSEHESELQSPSGIEVEGDQDQYGAQDHLYDSLFQHSFTSPSVKAESEAGFASEDEVSAYGDEYFRAFDNEAKIPENGWDGRAEADMDVIEHDLLVQSCYSPPLAGASLTGTQEPCAEGVDEYTANMGFNAENSDACTQDLSELLAEGNMHDLYHSFKPLQESPDPSETKNQYPAGLGIFDEGFYFENEDSNAEFSTQDILQTDDIGFSFDISAPDGDSYPMDQQQEFSQWYEMPSDQFSQIEEIFEYCASPADGLLQESGEHAGDSGVYSF
ncbi:hypothetical protein F5884DRAFT_744930 [Xylogone sp. PMI_703]|nr:hypothetical protein F5884DRAFT_744930 [Xylogone sp. PMI_703]